MKTEQIKKILADAPDGATHVDSLSFYHQNDAHNLADLRTILAQHEEIERLKAQVPKWISVEDELPEWGVFVLVFVPESDG